MHKQLTAIPAIIINKADFWRVSEACGMLPVPYVALGVSIIFLIIAT